MDAQDQGVSYTDLLCENSIVSLDDSPPFPSNANSGKKSKRGVNFTAKEDELVVAGWLNHSLDSIQGTDQKYSQLWENIYLYFEQHKETTNERSIKSLSNRWSSIQKATNTFCSCLDKVEQLNISGITDHDKFDKAKLLYHKQEEGNFAFEHCWNLLKDQPKWILRDAKGEPKKKRMTIPSPTPTTTPSEAGNAIENEVIELDRPLGRKAAKRSRKVQGVKIEEIKQLRKMKYTLLVESHAQEKEFYRLQAEKMAYDRLAEEEKMRLKAEKLRIEAEKAKLAKNESDQRIMMLDVSVMTELQRLYFEEL